MKKARGIGLCVGALICGGMAWRLSSQTPQSHPYQNCISIDEYLDQAEKYHTREFVAYYNQQYLDRMKKLIDAGVEKAPIDRDQIFNPFFPQGASGAFEQFKRKNKQGLASLTPGVKSPTVTRSQLFKLIPPPNHSKMIQDFGRKEDKTPTCIDGRINSNPEFYAIDDFRKNKNKTDFIDGKAFDRWHQLYRFYHFEGYILAPEIRELLYKDGGITSVYKGMFESDFAPEVMQMREFFIWDTFLNEDQKQLYLGSKIL